MVWKWSVEVEEWKKTACELVGRNLTKNERKMYVGVEEAGNACTGAP
jgi:hypothetical protein